MDVCGEQVDVLPRVWLIDGDGNAARISVEQALVIKLQGHMECLERRSVQCLITLDHIRSHESWWHLDSEGRHMPAFMAQSVVLVVSLSGDEVSGSTLWFSPGLCWSAACVMPTLPNIAQYFMSLSLEARPAATYPWLTHSSNPAKH